MSKENKPTLREQMESQVDQLIYMEATGKEIIAIFLGLLKEELEGLTVIGDDEIYSAVVQGFGKKVEATNLTDEIELKRHEGARQVAVDQLSHTIKELKEKMG